MAVRSLRDNLLVTVIPLTAAVVLLKYGVHVLGWEFIELNTLFTSIISANVFLLGFLLAGVLSDYKESERLPGDLAVSIDAVLDDVLALRVAKKTPDARKCLIHIRALVSDLDLWFHKKVRTHALLEQIRGLSTFFVRFEEYMPANYIVRLKQEQSQMRRLLLRIDTIRDTSFVSSGYRIAQINSMFLIVGMLFIDLDVFSNALFFTGIISFLFIYLLMLIKDLDNPFSFHTSGQEEVSLKLLHDLRDRLSAEIRQ